jgi:hypothetical protein
MKRFFIKKYWQIKYANWQITKFQYFYSWQNILKMAFAFCFLLPLLFVFVLIPQWFFDKLKDIVTDNMPRFLKVDENPEYLKMDNQQMRDFMMKFKTWD